MHDDISAGATTPRLVPGLALRLALRIDDQDDGPEIWHAWMSAPHDAASAEPASRVLTEATLHRVHYADPRWSAQLGDVEPELSTISSAFLDRELISMVDESSLFTDSLCVISAIDIDENAIGTLVSHALVRAIARVFDGDSIALLVARAFTAPGGAAVQDASDLDARREHWAAIGFVDIPGTTSMLLPVAARGWPTT